MSNATQKALFIHWGPGGNAEVEKRWFKDQYPVDWWTQPRLIGPNAFHQLIDAAETRLNDLAQKAGRPIALIAHCFGGQITRKLAARTPQNISEIVLLACGSVTVQSFIRLARNIATAEPEHAQLAQLAQKLETSKLPEDYWDLMNSLVQVPEFTRFYWANTQARDQYAALSRDIAPIDMGSFQSLISPFIISEAHQFDSTQPKCEIPVRCLVGSADALSDPSVENDRWKKIFPHAQCETIEGAGHFLQFELEPKKWLPNSILTP
jgi:pimeloyl-ACP methyl ester carboxylesterase